MSSARRWITVAVLAGAPALCAVRGAVSAPLPAPVFVVDGATCPSFGSAADRFVAASHPGIVVFSTSGAPLDTVPGISWPDWSPDGIRIASQSDFAMIQDIVATEAATGAVTKIWYVDNLFGNTTWAPDGTGLVFAGWWGLTWMPHPIGTSTSIPCTLPGGGDCSNMGATYSPDGTSLVFAHEASLWRVGATGGEAALLLDGSLHPSWQALRTPAWSPDGQWIAVHVASAQGQAIWVLGAGGKAAPLTDWMPEMVFGLDWTPASDAIYFGRGSQVWKVAFDPAVPAAATSWGRIKAGYR